MGESQHATDQHPIPHIATPAQTGTARRHANGILAQDKGCLGGRRM